MPEKRKPLDGRLLTILTKARYNQSELAAIIRDAEAHYRCRGKSGMSVVAEESGEDLCLFLRKPKPEL